MSLWHAPSVCGTGLAALGVLIALGGTAWASDGLSYSVGTWARDLGNHRAVVEVAEAAEAVRVRIPWRRRDPAPEAKNVLVLAADGGQAIANVLRVTINREYGDIVFQPAAGVGTYYVYYMPYTHAGPHHQFATAYAPPDDSRVDASWRERVLAVLDQLPRPPAREIQVRTDFDRMDPMEVIATEDETAGLIAKHPGRPYLLFPEDRRFPIRMRDDLPLRWIRNGPRAEFHAEAARGEFYVFQIGVYAVRAPIDGLRIDFGRLEGLVAGEAFRCINLGGVDWLGRPFEKVFAVEQGKVGALWCGVQIPTDAPPGHYEGALSVQPDGLEPTRVKLSLDVAPEIIEDGGDSALWRHARLRWLDSTIGLDDDVVAPYTPLVVERQTVSCLGRDVRFGATGLPESIRSGGCEILADPLSLYVATNDGETAWEGGAPRFVKQAPGVVAWSSSSRGRPFALTCEATMEFDGYLNIRATLEAKTAVHVNDIGIAIPIRREVATYMMGMGCKGGRRPPEWAWAWSADRANNSLWIGDVAAGLHCKLKGVDDTWNLYNFHGTGLPQPWENGGRGGCSVAEKGDAVVVRAFSGERSMAEGEALTFCFGLLVTPLKPLDPRHWNWRYQHQYVALPEIGKAAANIINIHHGNELNPHINYPFNAAGKLREYVQQAHENGVKVKIYYTVRELSNHVAEMWALRSLGFEVFRDGAGGGYSWLHEHLVKNYAAAWHEPNLPGGDIDGAILTTGLSRWHNYYLEGLRWLLDNVEIDGLYLDGIGYDRVIMQRVRKVMERTRPGSLIDFHSGNNFHPNYGLSNCANQYLEHFPYIDSLWFGEGFDYNESPDYWLVEISGIPFGLFGEMLQGGGNPWRGMIYGMTSRLGWGGDPSALWKLWDAFGIQDARMMGYWDPACPVKTDHSDILSTVYAKNDKALVSVASWAKEPLQCKLDINWQALGLDPERVTISAPAVEGFQEERRFSPADPIPVEPGRGWLLFIE